MSSRVIEMQPVIISDNSINALVSMWLNVEPGSTQACLKKTRALVDALESCSDQARKQQIAKTIEVAFETFSIKVQKQSFVAWVFRASLAEGKAGIESKESVYYLFLRLIAALQTPTTSDSSKQTTSWLEILINVVWDKHQKGYKRFVKDPTDQKREALILRDELNTLPWTVWTERARASQEYKQRIVDLINNEEISLLRMNIDGFLSNLSIFLELFKGEKLTYLKFNAGLRDEEFLQFLATFANLEKLNLQSPNIAPQGMAQIAKHTRLKTLQIACCYHTLPEPEYNAALLDIAKNCTKLQWLDLRGTPVRDSALFMFANACPELRWMHLMFTKVTSSGISQVAHRLQKLEKIRVSHLENGCLVISALCNKCPVIRKITLYNCTGYNKENVAFWEAKRPGLVIDWQGEKKPTKEQEEELCIVS